MGNPWSKIAGKYKCVLSYRDFVMTVLMAGMCGKRLEKNKLTFQFRSFYINRSAHKLEIVS